MWKRKKLDSALDGAAENQLLEYAQLSGAPYGVMTDGNRWKLYSIQYNMDKPPDRLRMFDVSIRHPNQLRCVEGLGRLFWSRLLPDEEPPPIALKKMRW